MQNSKIINEMDPRLFRYFERTIPKIRSRKFLYEPIRLHLLKQRPRGNFLEFIGSKELIDLIKYEPSLVNPLVLDRISEGCLQVKTIADLIKQNQCSKEILTAALEGYSGCILCYGQTGAGKTFSMTGAQTDYKYRGIVPRLISSLYQEVNSRYEHQIKVSISYL